MIIKDIVLLPDEKKMLSDLQTSSTIHSLRKSWIIKIISKDNIIELKFFVKKTSS